MPTAYIALGSNLGDRAGNLRRALDILNDPPATVVAARSMFLETDPEDCPPGAPPFLNAAAELTTELSPSDLLKRLLHIESRLGRRRVAGQRNMPRTLDLDLLLYGNVVLDEPGLVVPHPRLHQRRFVLAPLAEIAIEVVHPIMGETVAEMLEKVGG